jgi:hypothetical protein
MKFKIILTLIFLLSLFEVESQTTCASALPITVDGACENGAMNDATISAETYSCGGTVRRERWYTFTIGSQLSMTVAATQNSRDVAVQVFSGACGSLTEEACDNTTGGNGADTETISGLILNAGTYYIRVVNLTNHSPTLTSLCVTSAAVVPGTSCAAAQTLTPGTQQCGNSNNVGSFPDDETAPVNPCNSWYAYGEYWFSHVGDGNRLQLDLSGLTGTYAGLFVLDDCPSAGGNCVMSYSNGNSTIDYSVTTPNLTSGTTYYIVIASDGFAGDYSTDFCLDATIMIPPPAPANDDCPGAYVVTPNATASCGTQTAGSIFSATASGDPMGGCGGTANDDVWFMFDANSTDMSLNINDISGSTTDLYHTIYSGTCGALGAELICSDPNGSAVTGLTVGNTYYVRIYSFDNFSETSSFNVCTFPTPPAPTNLTCNTMDPICSGSPTVFSAQSTGSSAAAGPDYGCLLLQPDPTWFYMEIADPGLFSVDITAAEDIDFAAWGPYADLATAKAACTTYPAPVDCSYSTSAIEQLNIPGTLTGEYYVLVVTNFAGKQQSIMVQPSGSSIATTNCGIVPLPVGLVGFEARLEKEHQEVNLYWTTNSEINNEAFTVLRSKDGSFWETIGVKKGNGTTTELINYMFIDKNPLEGISYYKLKQTDSDGKFTYTPIRSVDNRSGIVFNLYPQPVQTELHFNAGENPIDGIYMTDLLGKEIQFNYTVEGTEYILNLAHLPKGIYNVVIKTGEEESSQRVVKM